MNNLQVNSNSILSFRASKSSKNMTKIVDDLGFKVPHQMEVSKMYEMDPMRARIIIQQDALKTFSSCIKDFFSFDFIKNICK